MRLRQSSRVSSLLNHPSKRAGPRAAAGPAARVVSKEGPYSHLNLAGLQETILQLEASPNDNGKASHKDEEKLLPLVPNSPHDSSELATHYTASDRFTGHLWNWLPFRLVVRDSHGNTATNRKSIFAALKAILERRNGETTKLTADEDWMLGAAQLIWTAQGSRQPSASLNRMDQEFSHLPMSPTKLNKELVRTRRWILSSWLLAHTNLGLLRSEAAMSLQRVHKRHHQSRQPLHEALGTIHHPRSPPHQHCYVHFSLFPE